MTHIRPCDRAAQIQANALRRRTLERRRAALENLRRLDIQLQTAAVLERRADLSANPTLAAVLRERADERRRIAEVVRAHLAEAGMSAVPAGSRPAPGRPHRTTFLTSGGRRRR